MTKMKKDQIDAFGKYSADVAVYTIAGSLVIAGAKAIHDFFNPNPKKGILDHNHYEDIHAFLDDDGKILPETINKNGQGVLVAQNYMGSDGEIYQRTSVGIYRKDGSNWIPVNI